MRSRSPFLPRRCRTVWISDIHLGFRGCSADFLLHFLRSVDCEYLYLVGDIIDIWQMKKRPYWPQAHNDVIRTILGKAKHGTQVVYVPGNHDELLRDYDGTTFGNIRIQVDAVHTMANGQRFLIVHGDEFDSVVKCSKALALIGGRLYGLLLRVNHMANFIRRQFGFPYWSLAAFLKHKVKNAVQYISNFEQAVAYEAAKRNVNGVICGHIHRAELTRIGEILYCNCGDWVESCTALVEDGHGNLQLLRWSDVNCAALELKEAA
ncbi:MAG: UDP-2,3-diacylglucosamine diphosphatase [Gammaproteobacteria bacterium]